MLEATFQDILERLADRLGHGVFVDSVDGRLIGHSKQDARADPARVAAILSRRVDPELRRWQNRHGIAAATAPVRLPANASLGIRARLCMPIRYGGQCLGYLWVPEDGQDSEAVSQAAAELSTFLSDRAGERDELLRRLLHPEQPDDTALDRLTALDPSLLGAEVVLCTAVPLARDRIPDLTADHERASDRTAAHERLVTALPAALRSDATCAGCFITTTRPDGLAPTTRPDRPVSTTRADTFVSTTRPDGPVTTTRAESLVPTTRATALYRSPHDPSTARDRSLPSATAFDRALRALVRRRFAVGVSDPTPFQADPVRHAATQARAAAEAAALDPALPRILPWSQAGPYRMLTLGQDDTILAPLERGGDAAHLVTTLETYLDLGADVQRTAAILHVHRTTVYYRLDRIATLLAMDLRDGLVRTHLHLALKSRRLTHASRH